MSPHSAFQVESSMPASVPQSHSYSGPTVEEFPPLADETPRGVLAAASRQKGVKWQDSLVLWPDRAASGKCARAGLQVAYSHASRPLLDAEQKHEHV